MAVFSLFSVFFDSIMNTIWKIMGKLFLLSNFILHYFIISKVSFTHAIMENQLNENKLYFYINNLLFLA